MAVPKPNAANERQTALTIEIHNGRRDTRRAISVSGERKGRVMKTCQSRVGSACTQEATWKQEVRIGDKPTGRLLYFSYWCDEHAARIAKRRETEFITPAAMTRLAETTEVS